MAFAVTEVGALPAVPVLITSEGEPVKASSLMACTSNETSWRIHRPSATWRPSPSTASSITSVTVDSRVSGEGSSLRRIHGHTSPLRLHLSAPLAARSCIVITCSAAGAPSSSPPVSSVAAPQVMRTAGAPSTTIATADTPASNSGREPQLEALYQAVTGQVPYVRDSDVAKMYAHLHDPAPPATEVRPASPLRYTPSPGRMLPRMQVSPMPM